MMDELAGGVDRLADRSSTRITELEAAERARLGNAGALQTFAVARIRFEAAGSRLWVAYLTLWVGLFEGMRR